MKWNSVPLKAECGQRRREYRGVSRSGKRKDRPRPRPETLDRNGEPHTGGQNTAPSTQRRQGRRHYKRHEVMERFRKGGAGMLAPAQTSQPQPL